MHSRVLRVGLLSLAGTLASMPAIGREKGGDSPSAAALSSDAMPTDPALLRGELENGLHYIVMKHAVPPGRAVMWVHMHTGSLNETEAQRGIAHYLEHMAFNGSEHFAPGTLVPFFQSMGMTFGRDQNAFTNFEQTTYQLTLPNTNLDTMEKGMSFFSDVVGRLSLLPTEIDAERQIIQEERRRGLSGRQRTQEYVLAQMTPGSLYGVRLPIGTEATINSVKEADFRAYYSKWYGASNATMIVLADTDPQIVVGAIRKSFGELPKRPRPVPQEVGVKAYDKSFAIVASDPEIRNEEVRIVRVEPPRPAATTLPLYRAELEESIADSAMDRRLSEKAAKGALRCQSASLSVGNSPGIMFSAEISARYSGGKWKEALEDAAMELQRARTFGFTKHEVEEATKQMIAGAERAVQTESTQPSSAMIARINGALANSEPIMSAAQRLALLKQLLPQITPEQVSSRFKNDFDPAHVAFISVTPAGEHVPTEAALLEAGTKALAVTPTQEVESNYATELLHSPPAGGKFVELSEHAASHVWSGWLNNNVRVHFKKIDTRKDQVSISVALIGGEMLETADNRGITSAAQLAWSRPSTAHLTSTDIRDLMNGKKVSVRGGGGGGGARGGGRRGGGGAGGGSDAITLSINGSPSELEPGFQLAYLLLTEPKIEQTAFDNYKTNAIEMLAESQKNPMMLGMRTVGSIIYPESEAKLQPAKAENIEKISLESSQKWLNKLIATSPIEVTIVGDIEKDQVMPLVEKYLGSLPSRERVSPTLFASQRQIARPAGARTFTKSVDTPTDQAFVMCGFYGADDSNRPDARALNMAARILSTRMVKEVREEGQLVYSISAASRAATTYPGFGVFSASAPTDPHKVDALVAKLSEMYATFAAKGPTDDEVEVARKQMAKTFEEQQTEPGYWSGRLDQMTFRKGDMDQFLAEPGEYQKLTAVQIQAAFAKYYSKDSSITVVVKPQGETGKQ